MSSSATGTVSFYSSGTAGIGDLAASQQPSNNDTVSVGLSGNKVTYTFKTTLTPSANEVLIGSSLAETVDNLASAINDSSTGSSAPVDGTDWATGTVANPYVSATVAAGSDTVTITDRVPCARLLAWDCTEGANNFTIRQPLGGADGDLLGAFAPGDTDMYTAVTLDTDDLSSDTIPGSMSFTSEWVLIDGRKWTIDLRSDQNSTQFSSTSVELSNSAASGATVLTTYSVTLSGNPLVMVINSDTESGSGREAPVYPTQNNQRPIYRPGA